MLPFVMKSGMVRKRVLSAFRCGAIRIGVPPRSGKRSFSFSLLSSLRKFSSSTKQGVSDAYETIATNKSNDESIDSIFVSNGPESTEATEAEWITPERRAKLHTLRSALGIEVSDTMLDQALTHSSYNNEHREHIVNNERMEFLGDTVLDTIISTYLYKNHPELTEGQLTSVRSAIVNRNTLQEICDELNLFSYLNIAKGDRGGVTLREKSVNIAGDTLEAIIAAVYLHGGLADATAFVHRHFEKQLQAKVSHGFVDENFKGKLQELLSLAPVQEILFQYKNETGAANFREYRPKYISKLAEESASAHMPTFVTKVMVDNECLGVGKGPSKKAAEKQGARMAYTAVTKKLNDHKMSCL